MKLPTVTLMIIDCVNANRAVKVIEKCKKHCEFGAIKFLTSLPSNSEYKTEIMPLNTLVAYSIFMLTKCHEYIDTPNVLIVQRDGFILNPNSFNYDWLDLDYIGPIFVQYDKVGSGGFSLRSKKMMQQVAAKVGHWDGTQTHADKIQASLGSYEDGVISLSHLSSSFKIGSLDQAADFAQGGNRNPKYYRQYPFGFHGTWHNINHETGFVPPLCEHKLGGCLCAYEHSTYLTSMEQ